jgi:hypothetical protein
MQVKHTWHVVLAKCEIFSHPDPTGTATYIPIVLKLQLETTALYYEVSDLGSQHILLPAPVLTVPC